MREFIDITDRSDTIYEMWCRPIRCGGHDAYLDIELQHIKNGRPNPRSDVQDIITVPLSWHITQAPTHRDPRTVEDFQREFPQHADTLLLELTKILL